MYKQQIDCTEEELCKEFKNLWPVFNRFWPEYQHETRTSQQRFLGHILSIYNITHLGISKLLHILISVAPSTGSLERSFSKLSNICYKERIQLTTKHLNKLYLLCQFKGSEMDCDRAIKILENNRIVL